MKRLREMTFEDYSSSEEEQNDNEFEMIVDMNFNDDFLGSRRGSQIHNTAAYTSFFCEKVAYTSTERQWRAMPRL